MKPYSAIWLNATLFTVQSAQCIKQAAIALTGDRIAWLGQVNDLSTDPEELADEVYDVEGRLITPGLIDCHTHVVFAGNRAQEFAARLQGASYTEIHQQGGGIQATVAATRQCMEETLFQLSAARVRTMLKQGVIGLEIKSGYGLDLTTELKMLRVAQRIGRELPINVFKTFLGAHTVPPEYQHSPDDYVAFICQEVIPFLVQEKLADAIDVFCEHIAFNLSQTERLFQCAQQYGLAIKCHAEQLSASGASHLAARYQALSADHLEFVTETNVQVMAAANVVAVLLPGAFYYLKEKQKPPIDWFRKYGVPIAIATDCNPGTSPIFSLPLIMNMACTLFALTPYEAWLGVTQHAAQALGWQKHYGSLQIGKKADFVVWDCENWLDICYYVGQSFVWQIIKDGSRIINLA